MRLKDPVSIEKSDKTLTGFALPVIASTSLNWATAGTSKPQIREVHSVCDPQLCS